MTIQKIVESAYRTSYNEGFCGQLMDSCQITERTLFAHCLWCCQEALKVVESPDPRVMEAVAVMEKIVAGKAPMGAHYDSEASLIQAVHECQDAVAILAYDAVRYMVSQGVDYQVISLTCQALAWVEGHVDDERYQAARAAQVQDMVRRVKAQRRSRAGR